MKLKQRFSFFLFREFDFFNVKNQKEESLPKSPVYLDTTPSESEKSDITGKSVPILIGEASSLGIEMISGFVPFLNFTL